MRVNWGLSNGTPCVFRKLIYDETAEHTSASTESVDTSDTLFVRNAHYALVEIFKSKTNKFDDLEPQIVPIPVVEKTFTTSLEQLYPDTGSVLIIRSTLTRVKVKQYRRSSLTLTLISPPGVRSDPRRLHLCVAHV